MSSSRANKPIKKPTVLSKKHVIAVGNGSKHVKLDSNSSESLRSESQSAHTKIQDLMNAI
jgi:hypothetical protein